MGAVTRFGRNIDSQFKIQDSDWNLEMCHLRSQRIQDKSMEKARF